MIYYFYEYMEWLMGWKQNIPNVVNENKPEIEVKPETEPVLSEPEPEPEPECMTTQSRKKKSRY
jgi:hypothetical protein